MFGSSVVRQRAMYRAVQRLSRSRLHQSTFRKFSAVLQSNERARKNFDQTRSFCANADALDQNYVRTSRDVDELFSIIDTDGNGTIDKSEFKKAMTSVGLDQLDGLRQSLSRNELSRTRAKTFDPAGTVVPTSVQYNDAGDQIVASETDYQNIGWGQTLAHRFQVTLEVMVSKIFPAGFGWQGASILADNMGMSDSSLSFALTTGVGDGIGVLTGHTLFMMAKKAVTGNDSIDINIEIQ